MNVDNNHIMLFAVLQFYYTQYGQERTPSYDKQLLQSYPNNVNPYDILKGFMFLALVESV